jgi:hypothetical protein
MCFGLISRSGAGTIFAPESSLTYASPICAPAGARPWTTLGGVMCIPTRPTVLFSRFLLFNTSFVSFGKFLLSRTSLIQDVSFANCRSVSVDTSSVASPSLGRITKASGPDRSLIDQSYVNMVFIHLFSDFSGPQFKLF